MSRTPNPNFMAGVPELMILRLLQGGSEMYGYQIVQAIRAETAEVVSLGEGIVYTVLHALERDKALKSRRKTVDGRSRTYYAITKKGVQRYTELANNWSTLTAAIQSVLEGKRHAPV